MNYKDLIPMYLRYRIMDIRSRGIYSGYPDKFKCIFIHIPKTAGTSIVHSLFESPSRHIKYTEYKLANNRKFKKYFKFSIVRNPWDRLVSTYFFLKNGGLNQDDKVWADDNLQSYSTFDDFVMHWITDKNISKWVHFHPQHDFIFDRYGHNMMDFIGRQENLSEDYLLICQHIGIQRELLKINVGKNKHYSSYYTDTTRKIVESVYEKDIAYFNYCFEEK